jgi:hypothetical protein
MLKSLKLSNKNEKLYFRLLFVKIMSIFCIEVLRINTENFNKYYFNIDMYFYNTLWFLSPQNKIKKLQNISKLKKLFSCIFRVRKVQKEYILLSVCVFKKYKLMLLTRFIYITVQRFSIFEMVSITLIPMYKC